MTACTPMFDPPFFICDAFCTVMNPVKRFFLKLTGHLLCDCPKFFR